MGSPVRCLSSNKEVDDVIRTTRDKVLALRFGRASDPECMRLDDILAKTKDLLRNMADVCSVEVEKVPVYAQYFDITLIPATIFFFNAQHMQVDWGTQDHTKFIGSFSSKQDFIDVIETIYRGALKGKLIVSSPLDPSHIPKYDVLFKDI